MVTPQTALARGDVGSWRNELLNNRARHFMLVLTAKAKNPGKIKFFS